MLWHCWLGGRKGIRPVKNWVVGCWVVICFEWCADLHMAQLMPLPLTVSCFSKIQIGFTFLVPAHLDSPGQRAIKRVCVCVCVRVCVAMIIIVPSVSWCCWLGIRPVKNWVLVCWHGYLSGARCKLFAYGLADAIAIPKPRHLWPHLNPDWVCLLVPPYPCCRGKEAIKPL